MLLELRTRAATVRSWVTPGSRSMVTRAGLPDTPKLPVAVKTPDTVVTVTASPLPMLTTMVCVSRSVGESTGSTQSGSGVACGQ
jgi:TPP-dependent trihydroxycyclohexane-1,2-dione (THcHDO) dehydratase